MKKPLKLKKKENPQKAPIYHGNPWKVLVVDDEQEVHSVTKMALASATFKNRPLELHSCFSAAQAREFLSQEKQVALILLDVVMESDHAGLDLVKYLRNELNNHSTRIILRTGQPGQAPEKQIIVDYDINDYKTKTELTAIKLFTAVIASLRSYADIIALETSHKGLEQIIKVSDKLLKLQSLNDFASGLLTQLSAFMKSQPNGILFHFGSNHQTDLLWPPKACCGEFAICMECNPELVQERKCDHHQRISKLVEKAIAQKQHIYEEDFTVLYMNVSQEEDVVSVIHSPIPLSELDRQLLEVFASKMTIGFQNLQLYENLEERVKQRTEELEQANQELTRLATTDTLTGALNRRAFMDALGAEIERSTRYHHPLSILIIDVDHFKTINDTYGHQVGDQVLRLLTETAQGSVRECDYFARFGGEEFSVLLPESDRDTAFQAAERIRKTICEKSLNIDGESVNISISIGVAELLELTNYSTDQSGDNNRVSNKNLDGNDSEDNIDKLILLADKRLYQAKQQGRNRCIAE